MKRPSRPATITPAQAVGLTAKASVRRPSREHRRRCCRKNASPMMAHGRPKRATKHEGRMGDANFATITHIQKAKKTNEQGARKAGPLLLRRSNHCPIGASRGSIALVVCLNGRFVRAHEALAAGLFAGSSLWRPRPCHCKKRFHHLGRLPRRRSVINSAFGATSITRIPGFPVVS